jgi:hypothetical protein
MLRLQGMIVRTRNDPFIPPDSTDSTQMAHQFVRRPDKDGMMVNEELINEGSEHLGRHLICEILKALENRSFTEY